MLPVFHSPICPAPYFFSAFPTIFPTYLMFFPVTYQLRPRDKLKCCESKTMSSGTWPIGNENKDHTTATTRKEFVSVEKKYPFLKLSEFY